MKVYVPYSKPENATKIALIGYDVEFVETSGEYGFQEYFKKRWAEAKAFIQVEQDCVPWPGAIEAIAACPEDWCTYDFSLPNHRDRDMQHETTVPPMGCMKLSQRLIEALKGLWDELVHYSVCDRTLSDAAKQAGFKVHQHFPGIVNANPALLPLIERSDYVPSILV